MIYIFYLKKYNFGTFHNFWACGMLCPTASYLFGPVVSLFFSSMQTLEPSAIFELLRRRFFLVGRLTDGPDERRQLRRTGAVGCRGYSYGGCGGGGWRLGLKLGWLVGVSDGCDAWKNVHFFVVVWGWALGQQNWVVPNILGILRGWFGDYSLGH